jgi:transposase, IS30 family
MRTYAQLTPEERYQIYILTQAGHRRSEIARMLNRDKSTIGRELRRNRGLKGYRPRQAHARALRRREEKARPRFAGTLWPRVAALLCEDWSPEQISGRLRIEEGIRVSHEWIYQFVYADKRAGGGLHRHLRCQKPRRKRYGAYERRGRIPRQVSIDERPAVVDARRRLGDWEGDTLIGKAHRGVLVSLVERKSSYTLLRGVERKGAREVREAVVECLAPYKACPSRHGGRASGGVHTLTVDNGREFADHEGIARALDADVYFAHPYASWERGLNENVNGLVRQYFPKKSDLRAVTREETTAVMRRLNHRPRKSLGFKTPHEVFFKRRKLTVALTS